MKAKTILIGFMFLALLSAVAVPARAQAAKPAVSSHPQAADTAAHKQLAIYLADFKSNPQDATLRQEIIELAKTLKPAPVVPLPARTDFARATAQLKTASTANDFNAAAKLFEQVATQAPWDADVYFNAASAYAQAADYDSAKRNLALYRSAVRPGVDTRKAEDLRNEIEQQLAAQQQQQAAQQFQQSLQQFRANPTDSARAQLCKLARSMSPPPPIPAEAHEHYVMAVTFVSAAKDPSGFEHAIGEYKAALSSAPWWADLYKKLAIAQEAANHYDDTIATLNLYLSTDPADAADAKDEIYKVRALKQTAADEQAKEQRAEQQRAYESSPAGIAARRQQNQRELISKLNGARFDCEKYHKIAVQGNSLIFSDLLNDGAWRNSPEVPLNGLEASSDGICLTGPGQGKNYTFRAVISDDGNSIEYHGAGGVCGRVWTYRLNGIGECTDRCEDGRPENNGYCSY